MNLRKMSSVVFATLSLGGAFASAADMSRNACKLAVAEARQGVTEIRDQFKIGEVSRADVTRIELDLLNVRFSCRNISFESYCTMALPKAAAAVTQVAEEVRLGMKDRKDLTDLKAENARIKSLCL